jgi:urease accessory protein
MMAATCAYAHTAAKEVGDFYAGFLHPVTALEHVLSFVGLGLLVGQQGKRVASGILVFSCTLMMGAASALWMATVPYVSVLNILSAVLLGLLVAAAWPLPIAVVYGIALVFGLSHGFANGTAITAPIRPYLFIPGIGLAGLIVPAWAMIIADFALSQKLGWMNIAVRVAGSWIAAIGILVLAISGGAILNAQDVQRREVIAAGSEKSHLEVTGPRGGDWPIETLWTPFA